MFLFGQDPTGGAATGAGGAGGGGMTMLIMMGVMFAIMYFLIIMPARKKQKQHQQIVNTLESGKRVMTSGGIYGTITRVMEDRFEIEVDKNTRIQVSKPSIQAIIDPQAETQGK